MWKFVCAMTCWTAIAFTRAGAQAAPKIGYVNSQEIMAHAPGKADAEARFDKDMKDFRAQMQRMDDSLRVLVDAFEKEGPKLDSVTRVSRSKAIQVREGECQKRAQELQQQMQERQRELTKPVIEQINKMLDEIRTQGHYVMILDVAAQGNPIVSIDKKLDLTDQVIARLKSEASAKTKH